jgi:hypothetical protein
MPKIPSWLNPKNWFVDDLSDEPDFDTAFAKARSKNLDEFLYKDKRYNTEVAPPKDLSTKKTFNDAFAAASKEGLKEFVWKGKKYTTKRISPEFEQHYQFSKDFLNRHIQKAQLALSPRDSAELQRDPAKMRQMVAQRRQALEAYLNSPEYLSITDQPHPNTFDGRYDPVNRKMFVTDNDETTPVHELAHKAGFVTLDDDIDKLLAIRDRIKNPQYIPDEDFHIYLADKGERAARHISTRFFLERRGHEFDQFTEKEWDILEKNKENLPYDIRQLMELYGDKDEFIYQMNRPLGFNPFSTDAYYQQQREDPLGLLNAESEGGDSDPLGILKTN